MTSGGVYPFKPCLPFGEPAHFNPERFAVRVRFLPEGIHRRVPCTAVGRGFGTVGVGAAVGGFYLSLNVPGTDGDGADDAPMTMAAMRAIVRVHIMSCRSPVQLARGG